MNGIIEDVRVKSRTAVVTTGGGLSRAQSRPVGVHGAATAPVTKTRPNPVVADGSRTGRRSRPTPRLARHAERKRLRQLRRQRLIRLLMASCAFAVLIGTLAASNPLSITQPAKKRLSKAPTEHPSPYALRSPDVLSATTPSAEATTAPPPQPTTTPAPAPPPASVEVPASGSGNFRLVSGESPVVGDGRLLRYTVELEEGLPFDAAAVATIIETTLGDSRSWISTGRHAFQRTESRPDVRIVVATPETTDKLCAPLRTRGEVSCHNGKFVVLNAKRWASGVEFYNGDVDNYRRYLINHEVGHALGHGHVPCPGPGELAPVMLQQTYGLDGCLPNAWPADAQ